MQLCAALLALMVAAKAPVPPPPPPAPSTSTERRVIALTEVGRSHISVTREIKGPFKDDLRDHIRDSDVDQLRVEQADRVGFVSGPKRVLAFSRSSPDDEVAPMKMAIDVEDGARDASAQNEISIAIS